jgi:ankyrin repeat protein
MCNCFDVAAARMLYLSKEGSTALMIASRYGRAKVVELLLTAGADRHIQDQV